MSAVPGPGLEPIRPRVTVSPKLARKLDRLARAAHLRHRWAHHPVCSRYAPERIQVGRVMLCRGCTFLALGVVTGAIVGALVTLSAGMLAVICAAAMVPAVVAAFARWRIPKLLTRWLPAHAFALACARLVKDPHWSVAALVVALASLALGYRSQHARRGADRSACTACPQNARKPDCDGFKPVIRRERAFVRISAKLMDGMFASARERA